jgi:hypothetical protein
MREPPRRYSVADDLRLPAGERIGPRLAVLLNGNVVTRVIAYDCDAGEIERYEEDENGEVRVNRRTGQAMRETLRGNVMACWREVAPCRG